MNKHDRVKAIRTHFLLTPSEFAEKIGIARNNVSSIESGKRPLGERVMRDICETFDVNMTWLRDGGGEMLKDSVSQPADVVDMQVQTIPLLPISAQGGSLNDFVVSVKDSECERVVSPIRGADFAMTVAGDSMTPEYPSGSQILIKKVDERAFLDWGKVYVLDTCNGAVIKKLMPSDDGDKEKVKCVSINSDYPPFEVNLQNVFGVYRVMLCMSLK